VFFMDSGLGGLPYLQWVQNEQPLWKLIYLADNACFPYGGRSTDFIIDRLKVLSRFIVDKYHPDLIVIACNTASVTALETLRNEFPVPFVGVVPAVKPAAESGSRGIIGVLATEKTVKGQYLEALIREFAAGQAVETRAASNLVRFVEESLFRADEEEIRRILTPYIDHIRERGWQAVVLGCTHFILLRSWFRKWLPSEVKIIDSTDGVGRRVLSLLSGLPVPECRKPEPGIFHVTGNRYDQEIYASAAHLNNMIFAPLEDL